MAGQYDPRVTPWTVDESAFPAGGSLAAQARFLLNYAILAPSGHNTQPWKFQVRESTRCLGALADYTRRLRVVDPDNRELLMTIGAALCNFTVAAAHFGRQCAVSVSPAPADQGEGSECVQVAEASLLAGEPDPETAALFPALCKRRTNRSAYELQPLAPADRARIAGLTATDGVGICLVDELGQKAQVATLIAEGDREQGGSRAFRDELAGWVRANSAGSGDGVAGDGFGIPDLVSWGGSWFIRSLDFGPFQARRSLRLAQEAPALVVIYGADTPAALLAAGQLLERLALALTQMGIQHSYLNQPIQVRHLRGRLRSLIGLAEQPQILLRVGYGPSLSRAMPRRQLAEVLI